MAADHDEVPALRVGGKALVGETTGELEIDPDLGNFSEKPATDCASRRRSSFEELLRGGDELGAVHRRDDVVEGVQHGERKPASRGLLEGQLQHRLSLERAVGADEHALRMIPGDSGRHTTTGDWACRITLVLTDPSRRLRSTPRPREPITTRCASRERSTSTSRGSPSAECVVTASSGRSR